MVRKSAVRPHYLRAYDDDLDGALALVVHDVVATNVYPAADARALVSYHAEIRLRAVAPDPEAGGKTALWVAEVVQEDLIEGVGDERPLITWPACPNHANHPLWLSIGDAASAAWTCPTTHERVAELGRL
jgi:hypothetical protein